MKKVELKEYFTPEEQAVRTMRELGVDVIEESSPTIKEKAKKFVKKALSVGAKSSRKVVKVAGRASKATKQAGRESRRKESPFSIERDMNIIGVNDFMPKKKPKKQSKRKKKKPKKSDKSRKTPDNVLFSMDLDGVL